ncbi:monooxygenase 2 [Ziziphus jujuba]|uniref:Monooxygenase 2 n=1 Tax=Ziziphus jujuba TaxID=326968 RepID=A0ABM3IWM0_ZIZJJ|nr:monooxygenase 2 [Ziziphus jujuba]
MCTYLCPSLCVCVFVCVLFNLFYFLPFCAFKNLVAKKGSESQKEIKAMDEALEDVVIVGAGIAGLTTCLGLHRQGIRSLVLESSESLRITGFALLTWTNAWKALDAVGIADSLRQQHELLRGNVTSSTISGLQTSKMSFLAKGKHGEHEVRCLKRKLLLEALANELPGGSIRFSSKVVSIEESGFFKLVHLADGNIIKTKVLIGSDGVNSVIAKWLGFKKPVFTGRSAFRGCANFNSKHDFDPMLMQFFGQGVRSGAMPCDDKCVYWFFTWTPSNQEKELEDKPEKMRQYLMSKLGNIPEQVKAVIENTELDAFLSSPLRYRHPWELLWGNISKGNVCVAGDALHPMTPDIGQGGCSALEDGAVLARCLGEALLEIKQKSVIDAKEGYKKIEMGLKKYAKERRWRSFDLIATAYVVGFIQEGNGKIISFLRDKFFAPILAGWLLKRADFDCGKIL